MRALEDIVLEQFKYHKMLKQDSQTGETIVRMYTYIDLHLTYFGGHFNVKVGQIKID